MSESEFYQSRRKYKGAIYIACGKVRKGHRLPAQEAPSGAILIPPSRSPPGKLFAAIWLEGWPSLRYNHPTHKARSLQSASRTTRRYAPAFLLDPAFRSFSLTSALSAKIRSFVFVFNFFLEEFLL